MAFENLPNISSEKLDGNLVPLAVNNNPRVLVLGTATKGPSETLYQVTRQSEAVSVFGKDRDASLIRGMYEVSVAGAENIVLFRIGATSAVLENVGGSGAFTIETVQKDDSAGLDYSLFYDSTTTRLRVFRVSDGEVVWDNNPAYPTEAIDLGEVAVTGVAGGGASIGTLSNPLTLAAANGVSGAVYTAGTDGVNLSRMQLYEALYNAYELLSDQLADVIVPMNVYLDDKNVMDLSSSQISALGLTNLTDYPQASAADDVLGLFYTEEVDGVNYFWWFFPADASNPSFTAAQIYPSVGSASATLKSDGSPLTLADFHEVNFAYQLADFCYRQSGQSQEKLGVIGTLPPASFALKHISQWVGKLPETEVNGNGHTVVTVNGTGLLGNKFMSGRITSGTVPGFTVAGVEGLFNGGFIATDSGFLDGAQLRDENESLVDIGKYISVVPTYPILSNPSRNVAYSSSGAPTYGGFFITLPPNSAPSNKILQGIRLSYRISSTKLDLLAGQRYVTFHQKPKGYVVSDAPTAARPESDYRRLSTMRIVKQIIDDVRSVGEPFLGEGMNSTLLSGLDTSIDRKLGERLKEGYINRYQSQVSSTPLEKINGRATVELLLVPAFELRAIRVVVGLAAV